MREDASLVYQPNREMGTRHLIFRRTNLPCLRCFTISNNSDSQLITGTRARRSQRSEHASFIFFFFVRALGSGKQRR